RLHLVAVEPPVDEQEVTKHAAVFLAFGHAVNVKRELKRHRRGAASQLRRQLIESPDRVLLLSASFACVAAADVLAIAPDASDALAAGSFKTQFAINRHPRLEALL